MMGIVKHRILAAAFVTSLLAAWAAAGASPVTVRGHDILVDGRPFPIHGAAADGRLAELKALGATTIRTYGGDPGPMLAAAGRLGMKVIAGLWLEPPRRGFDYRNRAAVEAQLASFRAIVTRYRNSDALLAWGIGNEVEGELTDDSLVWPAIEEAARLVKALDPDHPTMAVVAEGADTKVRKIMAQAPSIDILGVNSYGDALPSLPRRVRAAGWTGPIVVTELGALGQWQAGRTPWGAAIEPTSTEKAARLKRYLAALKADTAGQILFFWGQKQEVTPTWHGLLLADGEWLQASEAMAQAWGGRTPGGDHAPRIVSMRLEPGNVVARGRPLEAALDAHDPDGDTITVQWRVMAESTDLKKGGDAERVPPDHSAALRAAGIHGARVEGLPPGNYRIFAVVHDGHGAAATANAPFQVR
jgi:hypothetical protein